MKSDIQNIDSNTRIDNKAIQGSILMHRMYSELKKNGYEVNNPADIKTLGDLEKELLGTMLMLTFFTLQTNNNLIEGFINAY